MKSLVEMSVSPPLQAGGDPFPQLLMDVVRKDGACVWLQSGKYAARGDTPL